jgi:hypothetical protein
MLPTEAPVVMRWNQKEWLAKHACWVLQCVSQNVFGQGDKWSEGESNLPKRILRFRLHIQNSFLSHPLGTRPTFFRWLKDDTDCSIYAIFHLHQHGCRTQEHGSMPIVTACMHCTVIATFEFINAFRTFLNGQGINISSK